MSEISDKSTCPPERADRREEEAPPRSLRSPGPWHVRANRFGNYDLCDANGVRICASLGFANGLDADLAAAAPDLAAALLLALTILEASPGSLSQRGATVIRNAIARSGVMIA